VTAQLLELAGVRRGQAVLDIATGHGEPALSAARIVGPSGRVVGVHTAPAMLEIARRRASGFDNVEFAVGDMESTGQPAGVFDVVLSRFGLMFAVDHVAAFRGLADALVPGGVLAAATWGPPATHLMAVGPAALGELLELPAPKPGSPGVYGMSDPARLSEELAAAGFADISVTEQVAPFRFDSVEEYVGFNQANLPPTMLDRVRDRFGTADAPEAWDRVAQAVGPHVDADGTLSLPSVALCVRGVKPSA
jgi:SAM-dependent methyltransferase